MTRRAPQASQEALIDLNLLPVFDAVMRHGTVSLAAQALGVSQPTVSHSLNRLRLLMGDDLFVRTRKGMEPTAYAAEVAERVREGLHLLNAAVLNARDFDPHTSTRLFKLLMSDAGEMVFLPTLMRRIKSLAPGVAIEASQVPPDRNFSMLESGAADLAIGALEVREASLFSRKLLSERYVVACNPDHPWTRHAFSLEDYLRAEHVMVRPANVFFSQMERIFSERQYNVRPTLQMANFLAVGSVLRSTYLVATIPSYVAAFLREQMPMAIFDLPFELPETPINIFWHARHQRDTGNKWLRGLLAEIASSLPVPVFSSSAPA